ncbi:uncharacterized protein [Halyomorpha halys]|uniref:uncharacterized protein n=1 Tax=Halyomorpha halys TaxID=286706 RepID=UPI0006D4D02A|nr:uncharacterized protein LOC106681816 [Halyomorpha halys]
MGAACCKKLDTPTSPHQLPVWEAMRRYVSQMCPVDSTVEKSPVTPIRKYGVSDIVGPMTKTDCWTQTDPLPPPRRRKKNDKRRRSRSVEFLPYLMKDSELSSCSLENISGQEDAVDFQMYIMSRILGNDDGKESISGRKKEFLSGLLGEENNNLPAPGNIQSTQPEISDQSTTRQEIAQGTEPDTNSRRSSITESLKEFGSSLLEMLQDDEEEPVKPVLNGEPMDGSLSSQPKVPEVTPTPLRVERDNYILTPLEEENEEDIWSVNKILINNSELSHKRKDLSKIVWINESILNSGDKPIKFEQETEEIKNLTGRFLFEEKKLDKLKNNELPVITVESVS